MVPRALFSATSAPTSGTRRPDDPLSPRESSLQRLQALGLLAWLCFGGSQAQAWAAPTALPKSPTPFYKSLARVPGPGREWHPLIDRYSRFKLSVPADWIEVPAANYGDAYNLVTGEAAPTQGFSANLNVVQQGVDDKTTLKASLLEPTAHQMESGEQGIRFRVVEKAFAPVGGKDCLLLGGVFEDHGRTLRALQMRFVHRQVSYLFTFTCLDATYPSYEPLFARIMHTLVFERADGSWPSPPPAVQPKPQGTPALKLAAPPALRSSTPPATSTAAPGSVPSSSPGTTPAATPSSSGSVSPAAPGPTVVPSPPTPSPSPHS